MNALVKAAVGSPVSAIMVCLALVIVGLLAAFSLGLSELPEVRLPKLVVSTSYSGLPAQEVRTLLTVPLEDALASVRGLRHIESISREGTSTITVEFQWGTDLRVAGVELREALDAARSLLPSDARKPLVLPDPADEPLAVVCATPNGGDLTLAKRLAAKELKTRLQQVPGVGAVVTVGGLDEEVLVEVDRNRLASRALTLSELAQVLAASNYDYPAGTLTEGASELVVKAQGRVKQPSTLGDLRVNTFPVSDVATIKFSNADPQSSFSTGGIASVGLYIHRQPGASPVETVAAVRAEAARLAQDYGRDLSILMVFDGTTAIRQGLTTLTFNALAGVLIAFFVVFVFVRDGATSFIVIVTVPVAVIATLATLKLFGRTLNLFSIGGVALSIGMMVDHTVVVLETLTRLGKDKTAASVARATAGLSLSNIGATGTAVIVFLPVVYLPGAVGSVFADLSLAVMTAHVASFLLSVTLVPALFVLLPTRHRQPAFVVSLETRYRSILERAFRRPGRVVLGVAAVVLVGGAFAPFLRFELFPVSDDGVIDVRVTLPSGTTISSAGSVARDLEVRLAAAGFPTVFSRVGGEEDDAYYHADPNERKELLHTRVLVEPGKAEAALGRVRGIFQKTDDVEVSLPPSPILRLLGVGERSFLVTGTQPCEARDRVAHMRSLWPEGQVRAYPEGHQPEIYFSPDRPVIAQMGTDLTAVAEALRDGIDGVVPTKVTLAGRDVDVRVRMRASDRDSLEEIRQFPVKGKEERLLIVGDLGRLSETEADSAFYRYDRGDAVIVTAPRPWPQGPDVRVPADEVALDQTWSFAVTFGLVFVLLYLFLGAQLQSFGLPLRLLSAIPLSFTGVVLALVAGSVSVNVSSLLGVVALFGVVINNSILLFQAYSDRGSSSSAALIEGSVTRLRPILMTATITTLSLAPLAVNARGSAEGGMALALIGGLAVSTVLTLVVVPLLFSRRPN